MAENPRIQTRVDQRISDYIEDLIKTKLYGKDEAAVFRNLLEIGIRQAIRDGYIEQRDDDE